MLAVIAGVLSGLLGGVIGTVVAHRLALRRARQERRETADSYLGALKAEMRDNIELSARPIQGDAKVVLPTKQWEQAAPFVESLPPVVLDPIRQAYVAVQRYNSTVEYERVNVSRGHGWMDDQLRTQAEAAKLALENAVATLEQYESRSVSSGD